MHSNPERRQEWAKAKADLHGKGLDPDEIVEALIAGHEDAQQTTENDVITRSGYVLWATPLRVLGDKYVPKGWKRDRPGGFERLLNPEGTMAISVAAGSRATGTDEMPSSRLDRGPLTKQVVDHNRGQLDFASLQSRVGRVPVPSLTYWLLLHFYDESQNEIRCELSVPLETSRPNKDGRARVTAFGERLRIPAIQFGDTPVREDEEDVGEIDIPVERRR